MRVLNSANYGVPQIRKRVIITGVRKDLQQSADVIHNKIRKTHYDPEMNENERGGLLKFITVRDAISELPKLNQGEGVAVMPFE